MITHFGIGIFIRNSRWDFRGASNPTVILHAQHALRNRIIVVNAQTFDLCFSLYLFHAMPSEVRSYQGRCHHGQTSPVKSFPIMRRFAWPSRVLILQHAILPIPEHPVVQVLLKLQIHRYIYLPTDTSYSS
jgi:hypothetical protein